MSQPLDFTASAPGANSTRGDSIQSNRIRASCGRKASSGRPATAQPLLGLVLRRYAALAGPPSVQCLLRPAAAAVATSARPCSHTGRRQSSHRRMLVPSNQAKPIPWHALRLTERRGRVMVHCSSMCRHKCTSIASLLVAQQDCRMRYQRCTLVLAALLQRLHARAIRLICSFWLGHREGGTGALSLATTRLCASPVASSAPRSASGLAPAAPGSHTSCSGSRCLSPVCRPCCPAGRTHLCEESKTDDRTAAFTSCDAGRESAAASCSATKRSKSCACHPLRGYLEPSSSEALRRQPAHCCPVPQLRMRLLPVYHGRWLRGPSHDGHQKVCSVRKCRTAPVSGGWPAATTVSAGR